MSKNNTIRKSDKKFIRTEKARIRREFSDVKKQEELINGLYKNFVKSTEAPMGAKEAVQVTEEVKKEIKKEAKKDGEKPKKIVAKKSVTLGRSQTGEAKKAVAK